MIAKLSQLSELARPTAFHQILRTLDQRGQLLRVYTQNIDALEEKAGLTFGIPQLQPKRSRSNKGNTSAADASTRADVPFLLSSPVVTPRCIPLHGTLKSMYCQTCTHACPLRNHLDSLTSGTVPPCPECTALEATRQLSGKRPRSVGWLRPSVVLYNEDHRNGEEVGSVVYKDLMGSSAGKRRVGPDLLLVVGTSLQVPGTKRIVQEFSKALHTRRAAIKSSVDEPRTSTIYLNLDFPSGAREWEGAFDVWIRGDAQQFANMVHQELERVAQDQEAAEAQRKEESDVAKTTRPTRPRLGSNVPQNHSALDSPLRSSPPSSQGDFPAGNLGAFLPLTPSRSLSPDPCSRLILPLSLDRELDGLSSTSLAKHR